MQTTETHIDSGGIRWDSDGPVTQSMIASIIWYGHRSMKWAVAQGLRQDNPAGDAIGAALPRHAGIKCHQRALPHSQVADAIEAVRASEASMTAKLAFEFLVLTACRSGEVRLAQWDEIDLEARQWTIPGQRMKAKRLQRVPLSGRALEVLSVARTLAQDGTGLVFSGTRYG